ncbi:MAG: hypothetical protein IPM53_29090 [Anaerolineaceae bacterium]|nr:hypothetical protein [Anaerolineaceae bacterium]
MFTKKQFGFTLQLLIALLALSLLLAACSTTAAPTTQPDPTATSAPAATVEPTATTTLPDPTATPMPVEPTATAVPPTDDSLDISLDTSGMATGFQTETVTAVPANDAPYWEVLPEYTRLTLQGYPITNHLLQPQIFIYPVEELSTVNEGAGMIVTSLQTLIQSPQEITPMPFLPLFNATQVMHAHVQYLDFKNGQGLRYLTEFDQGIVPINNYELIYTYQGLTSDGRYYVAAVLPVGHPSLPEDATITGNEPPEFTSDFPAYLANVVSTLNPQAGNTFTPDLIQLDAMMSSLEIK